MKIRKLQIIGFKSFMERTRLAFDDGITGIVGPNGCGKSNVVDAIRWVMGEQSSRMLRGKAMEDVIFAGSESKPAMGMAEVEITFENDGINVPPEYASFKDISVGRRLFRSGESEYIINRAPCRLLDVQELFMGTGVGKGAYSIIGQGQIGLLVSQKPSERRAIIEEAAGISKYKARKKTAERKMEHTRQNLLRVADVIQEIRRNMGSLKRQARKAARFHKLREKLREIELHTAAHRYLEQQAILRHLQNKRSFLGKQETTLHAQVSELDGSVELKRVRLLDDDRSISDMQESLLSTDNEIKLNEQNIEFLSREVQSLSERGQTSVSEIDALRRQHDRLADEIKDAERELADLVEVDSNAVSRLVESEENHQLQVNKVEALEREIDDARQAQSRLGERSAELRSRLGNLDQRLLDTEGRLGQAAGERAALADQQKQLESKQSDQGERLNKLRQLHLELVERREFTENNLAEIQSLAAANEAKSMALREEISNKRSRLESLQAIERNFEGCMSGVRRVMQQAQEAGEHSEVVGLVADVLRAPPRYETAVQAVLGDRLQSIVVRSQDAGLEAVDYLKKEAEGRSSFIPLDLRESVITTESKGVAGQGVHGAMTSLVEFEDEVASVIRYLLGDVVVVEDLSAALALWTANGHKATLVTLDGEVLEPQGVLTGGSFEGSGTHLLASKREIRELTERLTGLEAEFRMVQDQQGKLKAQKASLASSIDSLRQNSHDEEIRIVDQQKDLHHLHENLSATSQKLEDLGYECQRHQNQIEEIRRDKEKARLDLDRAAAEQAELEANVRSGREILEQEKRILASLGQDLTELKIQAAATRERQESARRNQEHLVNTKADLAGRIERLMTDISSGNVKSVENKKKIEDTSHEISTLLAKRERQQAELGTRRDAYERLLAEVQTEEVQVKKARGDLDRVSGELSESNLRVREIEMDVDHLLRDVRRSHRLELIDCLASYHLLPPPGREAEKQAEKLRHDIERMGDVNPHAVEQYEELQERNDFLTAQSDDLNLSLDKLQKVIQKINRTSRKRFKEAFEAINNKFQEVFPRLFRGGRAHLVLEESVDLLEAGVDIVAQPPGKKLQNIELLSGGEKALTAVALLFSIFLIKPTPFCLLDEVDAPLDDANIERFNLMIKEMSKGSQFIIITHNKRTMEMLDRLYGVTMEEPGISTFVSVQLQDGGEVRPADNHPTPLRQAG